MRAHVRFDPPGSFVADAKLRVELDGVVIHDGSFLAGVSRELELAPGVHTLEASIRLGFARKRVWTFEVPDDTAPDDTAPDDTALDDTVLVVRMRYSRFWGGFERELSIAREDPSAVPAELPPPHPPAKPIATGVLLVLLTLVFLAELALGVGGVELTPSVPTLVALGGLAPPELIDGTWYRVLSCTFLHGSPLHLVFNGIALFMAGILVEGIVGWRWFLALYFASALAGSVGSLALNPGDVVSVGASGAIMGLFTAGLFLAQALPPERRMPVRLGLLRVLIPSMLPAVSADGARVDLGAHAGGALGGVLVGALLFALLRSAGEERAAFRRSPVALGLAGTFVLASIVALVAVTTLAYPQARVYEAAADALLPDVELPEDDAPDEATLARWLERYPDDPRVRIFAAERAADESDWASVDAHVAHGRGVLARHAEVFPASSIAVMEDAFGALEEDGRRHLVPNADLPSGTDDALEEAWARHLAAWLERYPDDPRVRNQAAWQAIDASDYASAEAHARRGLVASPRFAPHFPDGQSWVPWLRAAHGVALSELGRAEEASVALAGLCTEHEDVGALLADRGLCDGP